MKALFKEYAKWIRNSLQADCPSKALILLKRMDRLRYIWFWQVCREETEIQIDRDCSEYRKDKRHPRKRDGFLQSYYGRESNQEFIVNGCQGPAELICPYGGTIEIKSSTVGRQSKWECISKPKGKVKNCKGKITTAETTLACNGEKSCSFMSDGVDACDGIDTYDQIIYHCV